eukprot:evm.model.NODE_27857_length_1205_cov_40.124481.1
MMDLKEEGRKEKPDATAGDLLKTVEESFFVLVQHAKAHIYIYIYARKSRPKSRERCHLGHGEATPRPP